MPQKGSHHPIPTHGLERAQDDILLRSIDHRNQYDFTQLHRHSYFEVMFFTAGGGTNLIDFVEYAVRSQACYLIYPGQVHLLSRAPGSCGTLIQFTLAAVESGRLQRLLQEKAWSGGGAVMFEQAPETMAKVQGFLDLMAAQSNNDGHLRHEVSQHLLQALLFELFALAQATTPQAPLDPEFHQFLQLIDLNFKEAQTVAFYLDKLQIPEKRLAAMAQKYRGTTPLQIIHQRILLEAKRLLGTGQLPHKEIAYDLGFDSPASFSAFIKKKTGLTPSEIQAQMAEIPNR